MTVAGGESITQCSNHNNQWCCNGDATNVDCCNEEPEPRPFFNLQDGVAYATVGSNQASSNPTISTVTGLAFPGSNTSPTSQAGSSAAASSAAASSSPAGSSASSAHPTSVTPVTSVATSVRSASGSSGAETIYITNVSTPTATADTSSNDASSNDASSGGSGTPIGLIVGCAVGIPLALTLIGILIWMLRKRRQQRTKPYKTTPDGGESPDIAPAPLAKQKVYRHSRPGTSEIDSNPVGPGRPNSTIPGKAELESGAAFRPGSGVPYAPDTAFIGGGSGNRSTWGTAPPGYSPGQGQGPFPHNHEGPVELDSSMVMPVINEKSERQPQYQAYRPPPNNVVEMNAVKTPPEDVEKELR